MCNRTGAQALSKGTGLCKRKQGTLGWFGVLVPRVSEYHLSAVTPPTASAHRSAAGYFKQLRTMTGGGPNLFLCVVLKFRQFIAFYCMLSHLSLVLPAIVGNGQLSLFFRPLMASRAFHSCTYVKMGSCTAGSHLSCCVHSLSIRQLAKGFSVRVVANLVSGVAPGRGGER